MMQACYVRISELEATMKVLSKENDYIPAMNEDISRLQYVIDFKAGLDKKVTMLEKENNKTSALVKTVESQGRRNQCDSTLGVRSAVSIIMAARVSALNCELP